MKGRRKREEEGMLNRAQKRVRTGTKTFDCICPKLGKEYTGYISNIPPVTAFSMT